MQRRFAAAELVLSRVLKEIRKAKRRNEWIIMLEYDGEGHTMNRVLREIRNYDKQIRMVKYIDDGSIAVFHALRSRQLHPKHLRVVGVNTSACVSATVYGLRLLQTPITVFSEACANKDLGTTLPQQTSKEFQTISHSSSLRRMRKWKNIRVV